MCITNELLKSLYAKKAALQDEYWFNQSLSMKEYLIRYNSLNALIRPLEHEQND